MSDMKISLRGGERIYVNGAVLLVDRKVTLSFLNDVSFMLEHHVLQSDQATTPMRQLYLLVQTMLIDPAQRPAALEMFFTSTDVLARVGPKALADGELERIRCLVERGKYFVALKEIRALFEAESEASVAPTDARFSNNEVV